MAKTNPIGVRFRQDVLEKLKVDHAIESPQKALVFLEMFYVSHHKLAKDVTQILKNEQESQNKPHTDTKKEIVSETMPEGLNWKEQLEWVRNYKQKLKNQKT